MTGSVPEFMLADLSAEELAAEMTRLAAASTPEWVPTDGDPGKAIIDAVAWMGSTILYRVNLLPRRQRLEFLRLLGLKLRPAEPARGIVQLAHKPQTGAKAEFAPAGTRLLGPVPYETLEAFTVQPFEGKVFYKRALASPERVALADVIDDLSELYGVEAATPYVTTPMFENGLAVARGVDPVADSVDGTVWVALMALDGTPAAREAALAAFDAQPALLDIGVVPKLAAAHDAEMPAPVPGFDIAMTAKNTVGARVFDTMLTLMVERDSTAGFSSEGTLRLVLPVRANVGAPANDIAADIEAGLGDKPPRVDDPDDGARIVAWLRIRARDPGASLPLSWIGINAVAVDARQTRSTVQVATASGRPAETVALPDTNVLADGFSLSVEESGKGFVRWRATEDIGAARRGERVFALDAAAGTVTFGDGLTGRRPEAGARIRVDAMRAGGGPEGNVPAATVSAAEHHALLVRQPAALEGGRAAETLEMAEKRVSAHLQHNDRCVTAQDYKALAQTLDLARVEVLPRFRPYQRRADSPGVVSVVALPDKANVEAPNPRPDRRLVERVRGVLEPRRPLGTELYVIAPEYVPMAVSVAVTVRDGFAREAVVADVRAAVALFLWPLVGGGRDAAGWPLGQAVVNLEVELIAARVAGVRTTRGASLFLVDPAGFAPVASVGPAGMQTIVLLPYQLPECLRVEVAVDVPAPPDRLVSSAVGGRPGAGSGGADRDGGVAVPVVPEVC